VRPATQCAGRSEDGAVAAIVELGSARRRDGPHSKAFGT